MDNMNNMDCVKLSELLFPDVTKTTDYYEKLYPPRNLPEGAKVTRFAPSPTGFVHFGGLFPVIVGERLAHQSEGVFYLRIEDTDSKREVEGAEYDLIKVFERFGIKFDESIVAGGEYGPYKQSERKEIYRTYCKKLVAEGKAYPCFCTPEEMTALREKQEAEKLIPGYYGEFAKCRNMSYDDIEANIKAGKPYVLRFKSFGNSENKVKFTDLVKGAIEITENDIDHILLKSDGMPTYHLAHAVDDHLMHTTHVVRGEEWLSSLPYHIQLFAAIGAKLPKYMHISQLMRMDENGNKKKLSKRDKGAGMTYYLSEGYPSESVIEYVLTLLNSNYEDWRKANPDESFEKFPFSIKKMSASGSLFDLVKLTNVSKNLVSRLSADEVYSRLTKWAKEFDKPWFDVLTRDEAFTKSILAIGRGGSKPRKDLGTWADAKDYMGFFYPEYFRIADEIPEKFSVNDIGDVLDSFAQSYDCADDANAWFDKVKAITDRLGYCSNMKEYKADPDAYKGNVSDISSFIRVAVTGKQNAPDLYEVMKILGRDESIRRIKAYRAAL